ncbi:MAG TPA: glycosyltransferase family 39 protein [Thermoanaerobaculia bacterium]|nr:glycosyltransferase family 39 protein [Thermoanaerobaculia bacterium]
MPTERKLDLAALALVVFGMLRIASTWNVFSATVDEPMHVSAGLQLYTQHVYTYQPENPPLPRLVFALAPFLGGMEFDPAREIGEQLRGVFYSRGRYKTNLVLARCGNLLFFVLASIAVWRWARRELGAAGGFMAMLIFTMQPAIVAHAGFATHDMAATAGVAVSLLAFARWLDRPTLAHAIACGAAFAFAVLCKFSAIGYVPAAWLALYVVRAVRERRMQNPIPSLLAASATTVLLIWAGYAFTTRAFFAGIRGLRALDGMHHFAFLFGDVSGRGWWYYFPAALLLKATLATLLLVACVFLARRMRIAGESLAAALAILAVSMTSHLNLGVRYVLPIFAPLAVTAAATVLAMLRWQRSGRLQPAGGRAEARPYVMRFAAIALLAWHTGASVLAHPDTLPYFNELAGREPWRYLIDSNIDWGQDVLRLKRVIRQKKIERIGLGIMGWHDWDKLGFPPHNDLHRDIPTQGWVAVSEHIYGVARGAPWLEGRRYERVGKSIRLYYIP